MASCPSCRKDAPDGSRFCPFCGGKLAELVRKPQDPLVGKVVDGKYVIRERIGTGAMGSIYKAEHRALAKQVALKVLHRHLLTEESHVKRFHREAKAASRLNHPNAIAMLDFGQTEEGLFYIAMEYLPGRDLCRILFEDGKLPEERVVRILSQILDALDEAHAAGVIHRDLKPENVMVEPLRSNPDFVKVLDFGIAKIRDFTGSENSSFKTATGMVFGTPEYMSPEQIRGEELDGRSDLYSLGVLAYQMLSGELPFQGDSVLEVATAHLTQAPVPLAEKVPGVSPQVAAVVARLMKKKRDERFPNAGEVREALQAGWAQAEVARQAAAARRESTSEAATHVVSLAEGPRSVGTPQAPSAAARLQADPTELTPSFGRAAFPWKAVAFASLGALVLLSAIAIAWLR